MIFRQHLDNEYLFQVKNPAIASEIPNGKFLFNTYLYLQQQVEVQLLTFELWSTKRKKTVGLIHFALQAHTAVSPSRATFGGIEIEQGLSEQILDLFIAQMHIFLQRNDITTIKITNSPFAYSLSDSQQITGALLRNGYGITTTEINYHIPITEAPLEDRLHTSEKRRLRKCQSAHMTFYEDTSPDLPKVYAFIKKARSRKGFPMTLSLDAFESMFKKLPNTYRVFIVMHNDQITALTVTVRINKHILYNFYPADNEQFLDYSPTVFLTTELYRTAQREQYTMLDLGIATDRGQPNYGLMRFKKNLGGENSLRFTFKKELTHLQS